MLSRLVNQAQPLEPTARVLVLGKGYSGRCFSQLLNALGTPVISTRRKPDNKSTDIAFDSSGLMWVTDGDLDGLNNRVLSIDPATATVLSHWSAPDNQPGSGEREFNLPHAITVDACDRVYVADALNHRVQIIRTDGTFLQELACFGDLGVYGLSLARAPRNSLTLRL